MKKILLTFATLVAVLTVSAQSATVVIPRPLEATQAKGSYVVTPKTVISVSDESLMRSAEIFAEYVAKEGNMTLAVEKNGKKLELVMSEQKTSFDRKHSIREVQTEEMARIPLKKKQIYLKIDGEFGLDKDWAVFSYSLDGENWTTVGRPVKMVFDYRRMFMGSKFAIFNYATKKLGGYVDVQSFEYK